MGFRLFRFYPCNSNEITHITTTLGIHEVVSRWVLRAPVKEGNTMR
jgi:hypothetical protein